MPFLTQLRVREADQEYWWLLDAPLVYRGNKEKFLVPAGFKTDFASVPKLFWNIFPPMGKYTKAATLHDWLYTVAVTSRKDADGILRRVMGEYGVNLISRWTFYIMVRLFGGSHWGASHD